MGVWPARADSVWMLGTEPSPLAEQSVLLTYPGIASAGRVI